MGVALSHFHGKIERTGVDLQATTSDEQVEPPSFWRWLRTVAIGFAILFGIIGVWSAVMNLFHSSGADFLSFWAAGKLVLRGQAELAYNITAHGLVENTIVKVGGRLPFPYPPPFLLFVTPFAIPSFGIGFILWVAATAAFYGFATARSTPAFIAFGNTPACINFMIGQTGFLFCGIFVLGLSLIESAPFVGGAILGVMILKPQLALLMPVAMLAGREWRVIASAILSAAIMALLGLLLFGLKSYEGFWNILPFYVDMLRHNQEPWNELASPFALARFAQVPENWALAIHAIVALTAAVLTARAWWLKLDERIPILAASTMLMVPYFFTYDALLIVVPMGWLYRHKQHALVLALTWICVFIPIITYFSPWLGPNYISVAAAACLWALHTPQRRGLAPSPLTMPAAEGA